MLPCSPQMFVSVAAVLTIFGDGGDAARYVLPAAVNRKMIGGDDDIGNPQSRIERAAESRYCKSPVRSRFAKPAARVPIPLH